MHCLRWKIKTHDKLEFIPPDIMQIKKYCKKLQKIIILLKEKKTHAGC
jgi:hypothetical protein